MTYCFQNQCEDTCYYPCNYGTVYSYRPCDLGRDCGYRGYGCLYRQWDSYPSYSSRCCYPCSTSYTRRYSYGSCYPCYPC